MDSSQKGKKGPDENDRPKAEEQADRQELLSRRDALIRAGWSAPLIVAAVGSAGGVSPATWHLDEGCSFEATQQHCNHNDENVHADTHADSHADQHVDYGTSGSDNHVDQHADDHADQYADTRDALYHCDVDFDEHCDVYGDVWGP